MPFQLRTIIPGLQAAKACLCIDRDAAGWIIRESPPQYRPRHPERSVFYQLFETHFDGYVRAYEERFEPQSGPLRSVVVRSVEEFLSCGRLQGGFAQTRCDKCRKEHLLAFSCLLLPDKEFLFELPGQAFERERSLLSLLSQTAYASISKSFQALLGRKDVRPGCVLSLQTHGAYGVNFNPHCHGLVTDGAFSADGQFLPVPSLDVSAVIEAFRHMLLLRLHQAERLSESFMQNLLSWVHPGFSVFAGPPVDAAEIASLESQAGYITRPVLAMDALEKQADGNLVLETPPDPRTGATSIEMDPLEWIHRITSHIPDRGRHCQRFYGAYSNRGRISGSEAFGAGQFGFLDGSPQHVGPVD